MTGVGAAGEASPTRPAQKVDLVDPGAAVRHGKIEPAGRIGESCDAGWMGERKAEDAVAVVRSVLGELAASVARRDVDAIVASFEVGGVLLGTAATSVGVDAIRAYVETVVAPPKKLAWEWDLDALVAESEQDAIWFFAPGVAVMTDPDAGVVERAPMRLSGVLRRGGDGAWRWAQFHGSVADPR